MVYSFVLTKLLEYITGSMVPISCTHCVCHTDIAYMLNILLLLSIDWPCVTYMLFDL